MSDFEIITARVVSIITDLVGVMVEFVAGPYRRTSL